MAEPRFGALLRHQRLAAGLTQEELAERAGLSTRGISDLERGARVLPRKDTLRLLLQALDPPPPERAALATAARRSPLHDSLASTAVANDAFPGARLPVPLDRLIGREREVAAATALLRSVDVRLVTLTGPGGVGKTRLALAATANLRGNFASGVAFVGLAPVHDPALVLPTVADRLGIRDASDRPLIERLQDRLSNHHLLLVLDNFEHVVAAAAPLVELLAGCLQLKVLVTSRATLGISGERVYVVPPLDLPERAPSPSRERLIQSEAVRLFVARAQATDAAFVVTNASAPAVAEICHRLDGLPLAIELAAARVRIFPPEALLARLEQRLSLLTGGDRDHPIRLQTMRGAVAWSYDLLRSDEQALFRRLAIFVGGFTLEAAAAVSNDAEGTGIEGVTSLVNQSLLHQTETGEVPRFRMLETVREFGLERLTESGEADAITQRHAAHFVAFAETVATPILEVPDPALAFIRVDAEQGNLRAALAWAVERGEVTVLLRLVVALRWYWTMLGRLTEGRAWNERAVVVCEAAPAAPRAAARWEAGWFARMLGDYCRAEALAQESLALARTAGDALMSARALYLLGFVAEDRGELNLARARHEDALRLLRPLDVPYWTAHSLYHVGRLAGLCGDLAMADRHLAEALARCRREGHRYGPALVQSGMAVVALKRGDHARAAALWLERLGLAWDVWGLRWCLEGLAEIAVASGEHERAARLLGTAEAERERLSVALVPGMVFQHERDVAACRTALGEEAFAAAWTQGQRLTAQEARAEAARVRPEARETRRTHVSTAATHGLTSRELEVLRLVAVGCSNREIAEALFISVPTVKRHLSTILGKLQLSSRSAATAYAHTHDLV